MPISDPLTRELLRALVLTMADVQALKMLQIAHGSRGRDGLKDALEVAMHDFQPFLDSLDAATDQTLLDALKRLEGPAH